MITQNARIERTQLGVQCSDHGLLSFCIMLDYGGSGQGFGLLALDNYDEQKKERVPTELAASLLLAVDQVFGVDWEGLKGMHCRVVQDRAFGAAIAIGHFLKDKWLWYDKTVDAFRVSTLEQVTNE